MSKIRELEIHEPYDIQYEYQDGRLTNDYIQSMIMMYKGLQCLITKAVEHFFECLPIKPCKGEYDTYNIVNIQEHCIEIELVYEIYGDADDTYYYSMPIEFLYDPKYPETYKRIKEEEIALQLAEEERLKQLKLADALATASRAQAIAKEERYKQWVELSKEFDNPPRQLQVIGRAINLKDV